MRPYLIGDVYTTPVLTGPGWYARTKLSDGWTVESHGDTEELAKTNLLDYIISGRFDRDRNS